MLSSNENVTQYESIISYSLHRDSRNFKFDFLPRIYLFKMLYESGADRDSVHFRRDIKAKNNWNWNGEMIRNCKL